ncbi:MAG: universal stress protein [Candidatus Methanoperedens sp.]|nr:MAG: universal stress protein [Candidatus Methanoperedens sp.]
MFEKALFPTAMSTRGMGVFRELLLGGTARDVVRHTKIPNRFVIEFSTTIGSHLDFLVSFFSS